MHRFYHEWFETEFDKELKKISRRDRRFTRKQRDKELIALDERRNKLWEERAKGMEYVEIEPYRNGYIRYFDLREDLVGRSDYKYIREALDACNIEQYCRNKKFHFTRKYYRSRYSRYFVREMKLNTIQDKEYNKLSDGAKNFFDKEEKVSWSGVVYNVWHSSFPVWMLVVKIKPHIIRYRKVYNVDIESQLQELRNKIDRNDLAVKINHVRGYKSYWRDDWDLSLDRKRMINKTMNREMEDEAKDYLSGGDK
jgi:hypothetical protein